jgi:molybdopterin-guanine dinucleotide biosynthesis protein A
MGREKLSLEVEGVPLIQRVRDALTDSCQEVLLVGDSGIRPERVGFATGERPGSLGPLAGMEAGLTAATNRLTFVVAGDMPFLCEDLVGYLIQRLRARDVCAVVPRHGGGIHPLCAAYDREVLPLISAALDEGVRAVHEFLEGMDEVEYVGEELRRFGDPDLLLMNVNSPGDLERARHEARR